jgi:hypothetical protein
MAIRVGWWAREAVGGRGMVTRGIVTNSTRAMRVKERSECIVGGARLGKLDWTGLDWYVV